MKFSLILTVDHALLGDAELERKYISDTLRGIAGAVLKGGQAGAVSTDGKPTGTWKITK